MKARLKTSRQQKTRNRLFLNGRRAALVVAGLVIGFGLALPQDSLAGKKPRHHTVKKVHVERGHQVHRRSAVSGHFTIPPRIVARAEIKRHRPYDSRRFHDAPHRPYRQIHDFPVYSHQRRVHRPYAYRNGHLYGGPHLSYSRPGFSLAVGW